jgi:hypothetical protein
MRYVVGRDRQAATGQLLINFVYLVDNFRWENISSIFRVKMGWLRFITHRARPAFRVVYYRL